MSKIAMGDKVKEKRSGEKNAFWDLGHIYYSSDNLPKFSRTSLSVGLYKGKLVNL